MDEAGKQQWDFEGTDWVLLSVEQSYRMANKNGFQQKSVHFPFPPAISLVDIGIPTSLGTLLLLLPDAVEKREQGLDVE
jgi:hypothetical protein